MISRDFCADEPLDTRLIFLNSQVRLSFAERLDFLFDIPDRWSPEKFFIEIKACRQEPLRNDQFNPIEI